MCRFVSNFTVIGMRWNSILFFEHCPTWMHLVLFHWEIVIFVELKLTYLIYTLHSTSTEQKPALSITWPLIYTFGPSYAVSAVYQLLYSTMQFVSPQIVNLLIAFVQNDEPTWRGYFYTVLICSATFMCTIFNSQCFYQGALHLTIKSLAILLCRYF